MQWRNACSSNDADVVYTAADQFFTRVGKDAVFNTAVLPWATRGIQRGISNAGYERANDAPLHILSPIVGSVFRAVKAVLPIGLSR